MSAVQLAVVTITALRYSACVLRAEAATCMPSLGCVTVFPASALQQSALSVLRTRSPRPLGVAIDSRLYFPKHNLSETTTDATALGKGTSWEAQRTLR